MPRRKSGPTGRGAGGEPVQRSLWDEVPSTEEPVEAGVAEEGDAPESPLTTDVTPPPGPPTERGPAPSSAVAPRTAQTVIARSSRALEDALLARVEQLETQSGLSSGAPPAPGDLAPIRIVVPSRSLRSHLLAAIARRTKRPILGLVCQTHHGLARDILARAGAEVHASADLSALLARRYARTEPALAGRLGHLHDGLGAVVGTVRDFIDAGLDAAHVEGLLELLAEEGAEAASYAEVERAGAVLRVAARTLVAHEEAGVAPASGVVHAATEALRGEDAPKLLSGRATLIYGYADTTGVTAEFLRALLSAATPATLFVERPDDPADASRTDRGWAVSARFLERLTGDPIGGPAEPEPKRSDALPAPASAPVPAEVEGFRALGTDAESREVATRCRALLAAGVRPESIGVVARDLKSHATPLARHLTRLGLPFSGVGPHGHAEPFSRRAEGLLDLLRDRRALKLDRWFELVSERALSAARSDLKLALAAAGRTRVEDLIGLDLGWLSRGRDAVPLPIRVGIVEDSERRHPQSRAPRRTLSVDALRTERDRALSVLERLDAPRPLGEWVEIVSELLGAGGLAWAASDTARAREALASTVRGLPPALTLEQSELATLFERALRESVDRTLGGAGGGIQILDVTESRGRTYDHLFVVGLNRGAFPRAIHPDPLLPDPLRERFARSGFGPLPDLPIKRDGFDEERFLFAQLLGSSPRVTLSWLEADAEGRPAAPSPLVERLQWTGRLAEELELAGEPYSAPETAPRAPWERGVQIALAGDRSTLGRAIEALHPDGVTDLGDSDDEPTPSRSGDSERWARARIGVLHELNPVPGSPAWSSLGPYYGFVGAAGEDDPRRARSLFVTTLEQVARCPWQAFLEKLLALESYPDPFDALPRVDPLRTGALVHRVLEDLARPGVGESPTPPSEDDAPLDALAERAGAPIDWSSVDRDAALRTAADALVRELGTPAPGFAAALARAGRPYLDVAARLDGEGPRPIVGVEVFGAVSVPRFDGGPIDLHFRADRVERTEGGLRWSDFKSGKPFSDAKTAKTRDKHLHDRVRSGEALQVTAYALARGAADAGQYLFLRPDLPKDDAERRVVIDAGHETLVGLFHDSVARLAGAWYGGTLPPRLSMPTTNQTPQVCERCDVAEACLQGDSGARTRMREWFADGTDAPEPRTPHEPTLRELWFSGSPPKGGRR